MARKKSIPTVDELIQSLPNLDRANIPRQILEAIKAGKLWSDPELADMFRFAPNVVEQNSKSWLPRSIQVKIGKIQPIKVVVRHARHQSSRRKAVYQLLSEYVVDNGEMDLDVPVYDAYMISCTCGVSFIGKEPEHQLQCEVCKLKIKQKTTNTQNNAKQDQIITMFRIINKRNLRDKVRSKAIKILKNRMETWGFTQEEILYAFENQGYTREQVEAM